MERKFHMAAYTPFNPKKYGGEVGDRPDGQCLYIGPIVSVEDIAVALVWGLKVGFVLTYEWTSPVSHSVYTLCIPRGIVLLQTLFRRKCLSKLVPQLHMRQLIGRWACGIGYQTHDRRNVHYVCRGRHL